jgi:hypothetical protein
LIEQEKAGIAAAESVQLQRQRSIEPIARAARAASNFAAKPPVRLSFDPF